MQAVPLTETRAVYLAKVANGGFIRQSGGPTSKGGRNMPEPTWLFLVENGLVSTSCGEVSITRKGQHSLDAYG